MPTASARSAGSYSGLVAFARRHQLAVFFVFAYALSWWAWIWYLFTPAIGAPILSFGPFVAAVAMLALVGGRAAVRAWLGKIVHWRVAPWWYALALLGPPALTFGALAVNLAVGAAATPDRAVPTATDLVARFATVLVLVGLGEEPAWRGYALPRLLAGRSALAAALLLGVLHAVWHLPLFGVEYDLANGVPWLISVLCVSVVIAWMWLHTAGSLLLPMLLHTANNTAAFVWQWFTGADQLRLWWIWTGLWLVAAGAVVAATGPRLVRRPLSARQKVDSGAATDDHDLRRST
jgi:membrane protease YdiL (CAAX protease family)